MATGGLGPVHFHRPVLEEKNRMSTLLEKIRKPQSESVFRLPAIVLKGEAAERMTALIKITGLAGTKLAIQILSHTLESDAGIRKLLSEAEQPQ